MVLLLRDLLKKFNVEMKQIFIFCQFIFTFFIINNTSIWSNTANLQDSNYLIFPKPIKQGIYNFAIGIGVTRFPNQVVEEEINYSPTLNFDARFALTDKWYLVGSLTSNYITNNLSVGPFWSTSLNNFHFSVGLISSGWYSHLNVDAIKLNTYGITATPRILMGYNLFNFKATLQIESHHHIFWNYLEKEYLGSTKIWDGGFSVNLVTEQTFIDNINTIIGLRFHYTKFYYQSWLAYSVLDEYLFYPEFYFGVIL